MTDTTSRGGSPAAQPASGYFPRSAQALFDAAHLLLPDLERGRPIDSTLLRAAMEEAFDGSDADGQPKAAITPQGDLVIEGKPVAMTDAQRKLALDYRAGITAIAEAGIDIGLQGADLAGKAVTEALAGVFTGKGDEVEKHIEHHAEGIKASALKLCERMPALLEAQNRLADALPEFKPYATMDQQDIDDCGKDGNVNLNLPGVHVNADAGDDDHGKNTAAEAEAAASDTAK